MIEKKSYDEVYNETLKYFNNEMATDVFLKKYSLNKEETPSMLWDRLTKEFNRIENEYKKLKLDQQNYDDLSKYGKTRYNGNSGFSIENLLENFKYIIPGGSGLEGIGANKNHSLANCFKNTDPQDNIDSIFEVAKEVANISKMRGGTSIDVSYLRPEGAIINNASKESRGVTDWMHLYNATNQRIGQMGRVSGTMVTISDKHPDILNFIQVKRDHTQLTNTNISVKFSDDFINSVKEDKDWLTYFPVDETLDNTKYNINNLEYKELNHYYNNDNKIVYIKKYKAKELWDEFLLSNKLCGDPGCLFWDRSLEYDGSTVYPTLKPTGVNLCSELFLSNLQSCILIHVNLFSLIDNPFTKDAKLNEELAYKIFYECICLGDDFISLEEEQLNKILIKVDSTIPISINSEEEYRKYCIENYKEISSEYITWIKVKNKLIKGRKIGCGAVGLGDFYAALNLKYGDYNITKKLSEIKLKAELDSTIDMAIIRNPFPLWDNNFEYDIDLKGKNKWYQFLIDTFPEQINRMIKYGRRNVTWSSYAPTGTVAIMCGTTSGIEPLFAPYYTRRRKIFNSDEEFDFVDVDGQKYKNYVVVHPKLMEWYCVNNDNISDYSDFNENKWKEIYEKSPYYKQCANDLDLELRTKTQGLLNKYLCSSISSTVNLPSTATEKDIEKVYLTAYHNGCKSITCYVDGSKGGVLVTSDKKDNDCDNFQIHHAPKLPKVMDADFYKVKYKGETYIITVGMYCDHPCEIFTFKPTFENIDEKIPFSKIKEHKGKRKKIKKGLYSFDSEFITIPDLGAYNSVEEKQHSINISMMLRHGIPIQYIINTTKKYDGNISSFASVINRILSKYTNNDTDNKDICPECGGTLKHENSCIQCPHCGWSKCS